MGIENGMMKIEVVGREQSNDGNMITAARIFSYPVGGKSRDVAFHFEADPEKGWPYGAMPAIGQKVQYDGPAPDMAGHLMVDVYPCEEVA